MPDGPQHDRGPGAAVPRRTLAPVLAAVLAAAVVLTVGIASRSDATFALPPEPIRAAPAPLDALGISLDRCAAAIEAAGLTSGYPERADWRPLARLVTGGIAMTMLDGPVPFVCATGPTVVEVSDPRAAVPVGPALLLLSGDAGMLAATALDGRTVEVAGPADGPPGRAATHHFLRVGAGPVTDARGLTVAVGDASGVQVLGPPDRLAAPALHVVDRSTVPPDRSSGATDMLRRCVAARPDAEATSAAWDTAQVLAYRRGAQPASLLVTTGPGVVGGCSLAPGEVTPLRLWWAGEDTDGERPFVWLPQAGATLPDLDGGIAAGPVGSDVARMEVDAGGGTRWHVGVVGSTFATQLPDGMPRDARELTVRAYDAQDRLLFHGPAAG